jgi:hypothetical protein
MTPEGQTKKMITSRLVARGLIQAKDAVKATTSNAGKFVMPVPSFRGTMGIPDYYGHYRGRFFEIEAKRLGEEPTQLQQHQLDATGKTGGASFAVDGPEAMDAVERWMDAVDRQVARGVALEALLKPPSCV